MQDYKTPEELKEQFEKLAKEFGKNLATARNAKGYTQQEVAQKIGKENGQTVSNWEKGHYPPKSFADAIRLSDVLDVDLDYLTGRLREPTHDIQFIHDQTGLTGEAVKKLQENRGLSFVLSLLIEQSDFIPLLWTINQAMIQDVVNPAFTGAGTDKIIRDENAFSIYRYLVKILEDISPDEFIKRLSDAEEKKSPVKWNPEDITED